MKIKKLSISLGILLLSLCTAAVSVNAQNPFSFAYLADIHIAEGAKSIQDVEKCITDINSLPELKFVIFAGDITEFGSDEEIKMAKDIFDKLNKPYYIVAGNHDSKWSESGCNTFVKVFGYEGFNFDYEGIKFVGSNSGPNMRMAPALVPRETIVWLDSLEKKIDPNQPVFFINHFPMDTSVLNYTQVLDVLKKMNTQLILNGHWHQDRAMVYEGIPAVIGRSSQAVGKDGPGYNIITVDGSTVTFKERVAEVEKDNKKRSITKTPWNTLRMSNGKPYNSLVNYPRSNFNINDRYPSVKSVWRFEDKADIGSGAIEYNGYVVFANTAGVIYCLNLSDGSKAWEKATNSKIFSTPSIYNNIIVIGSTNGNIYGIDLKTGTTKWTYSCNKSVLGSPTIFKGIAYIGASDNTFRAIDVKNGKLKWEAKGIRGFIEAKPFVDNEQVVIGDWANTLYSFNTKNGKLQWEWRNKGSRMLSPAAVWPVKSNGKIFFTTPERMNYALDAKTGKQLYRESGGRESIGLSPLKDVYFIKTMKDTVIAYSTIKQNTLKDGTVKPQRVWAANAEFGYEIAPTPIVNVATGGKDNKGIVFIPTDKGNIVALNAVDGTILWKHKVSFALINEIVPLVDNKLLISTMDGIVTILKY